MRVSFLSISAVAVISLAGCGSQQAEFTNRKEINDLVPEAQDHVRTVLSQHFGTPTHPVAWERLPVHFHGAVGAFDENAAPESGTITTLKVNLGEPNQPIEAGQEIAWVSGKYAGQPSARIAAYHKDAGTIELEPPGLSEPPDAGDRFAIAPGAILIPGRMLYAEHCQHCHGASGDGAGPTAEYLNPKPRDYRLGKFKFTSTVSAAKASREDLARTIEEGIPGTYMPSFKLLEPDESAAIVEYIRWLAMRGEIEFRLIQALKNDYSTEAVESSIASAREDDSKLSAGDAKKQIMADMQEYLKGDWVEEFNDDTKFQAEQWRIADEPESLVLPQVARVANTPESRANGRKIYLSAQAKCVTCHGESGLGDGSQTYAVQKNPATNSDYEVPGLFDDWGNPLKPRNLTRGIYRGGRRPIDLYRRISAGIKGTPMPAFGTVLKDEQIWDLVNYVTSIPFKDEPHFENARNGAGLKSAEVAATESEKDLQVAN